MRKRLRVDKFTHISKRILQKSGFNNFNFTFRSNPYFIFSTQMKRKITLKQIAKELDVSISTVSKSLRDSPEISEDTRLKVQAFARLYNYRPNNIALSLKNRKTKTIGIIIPEIVHHFFATVISGMEQVANENGYSVLICLSDESFDKEVLNMEMLANGSIDGFIMALSKETQYKADYHHITEVIEQGMPVVMFDRVAPEILCDKVIIDDKYAAYTAVNYLIEKGRKRIALLTTVDYVSVGKLRTDGYVKALLDQGIEVDENLILRVENMDNCAELIQPLITHQQIDAILAVNELFAAIAINAAQKSAKKVPEDISVIAFTDGIISKFSTPTISTISQNGIQMGRKAASMLITRLENQTEDEEEHYRTEVIETHLIERDSTRST